MRRIKWILLALYLILMGLSFLGVFAAEQVAGILALVAGVMFIVWY